MLRLPRCRLKYSKNYLLITNSIARASSTLQSVDFGDYSLVLPEDIERQGVAHIPYKTVPANIRAPPYASGNPQVSLTKHKSNFKPGSTQERKMREACHLARDTLEFASTLVQVGISTEEIDDHIHEYIIKNGAYPSPLKYKGFPKSVCTSVNNIVSHGIPDKRLLESGDIVNVDVTVFLDGFHGDTSRTFPVGEVDDKGHHLLFVARGALQAGISACGPGRPFKYIGNEIHQFVHGTSTKPRPDIEEISYTICESFTGHGVGEEFHSRPWIVHTKNQEPGAMSPGDCFTIEPVILQTVSGIHSPIWIWPDGWTASTESGARGAVFEHTILITDSGVEVLTL